jgi:hypothetical protein
MQSYRLVDRLTEPTSYIGLAIAAMGAAIPAVVPPAAWAHVAGCVHVFLGAAAFFWPENRFVIAGEAIEQAVANALPKAYGAVLAPPVPASAAGFGPAKIESAPAPAGAGQGGFALRDALLIVGGVGLLGVALSLGGCGSVTPQQAQTISTDLACYGAAAANAVTQGFVAAGDTKNAAISSAAAAATGALCTGLPPGTPLAPAPAASASLPPAPSTAQPMQTIPSELACFAQAAANAVTQGFDAAGDTKNAAISSAASAATGSLCTGLPVGTPLSPPAAAPAT